MEDCIFCNIIKGDIPSEKVYEDDFVYAFKDISPVAPFHVLIIPKQHIRCVEDVTEENSGCIAKVYEAAAKIAADAGLMEHGGYRIVNNCGEGAGQTVWHLHFHMLGGRDMTWPPG